MNIESNKKQGRFFVLSSPSGGGKSTIKDLLVQRLSNLVYSVSFTTRQPREGEKDGLDYHFITEDCFKSMIARGEFLEWAEVFGHYYGTSKILVNKCLCDGRDVLADLDVVGAASVKTIWPQATLIFLVPPTALDLKKRLAGRKTETTEETNLRLRRVKAEIERRDIYDFMVINDNLNKAVDEMVTIITEGCGRSMLPRDSFWVSFFNDAGLL